MHGCQLHSSSARNQLAPWDIWVGSVVQFLDVEFNLKNGTFKPFLKPGDSPLYVNTNSNHPPSILKNIPEAINRRLSNLSSDENMFNEVAPIYQKALENAGYKYKLKYTPHQKQKKKNRNRKRDVCWWNPPFSKNVKTKVGAKFFKLLDTHFPQHSPLHKVINRNTVKMSYRTTPNFKQIIVAHNAKIPEYEHNVAFPKLIYFGFFKKSLFTT